MEIKKNYNEYKKYQKQYSSWESDFEKKELKRLKYLEQNPLSKEELKKAEQKGKILLNAVDIMDEYSQLKAEDTEILTNSILRAYGSDVPILLLGLSSLLFMKIPKLNKFFR